MQRLFLYSIYYYVYFVSMCGYFSALWSKIDYKNISIDDFTCRTVGFHLLLLNTE